MTGKQKYSPQGAGMIPPGLWAASLSVHCGVSLWKVPYLCLVHPKKPGMKMHDKA